MKTNADVYDSEECAIIRSKLCNHYINEGIDPDRATQLVYRGWVVLVRDEPEWLGSPADYTEDLSD